MIGFPLAKEIAENMPSLALRGVCFERLPLHRVSESCKGFLRLLGLQDAGVFYNPGILYCLCSTARP